MRGGWGALPKGSEAVEPGRVVDEQPSTPDQVRRDARDEVTQEEVIGYGPGMVRMRPVRTPQHPFRDALDERLREGECILVGRSRPRYPVPPAHLDPDIRPLGERERSEEHTSETQPTKGITYAVF